MPAADAATALHEHVNTRTSREGITHIRPVLKIRMSPILRLL